MSPINLLPQEKKNLLKEKQGIFYIKNVSYFIAVFILVTIGVLYAGNFYLDTKFASVENEIQEAESSLPGGETHTFSSRIKEVNSKISFISEVQNEYTLWSSWIADLSKLIPDNVSLTQLTISPGDNSIQISGNANLRDDFLTYKSNLENSDLITNVESPISNLIKRQDITFNISGTINIEEYKIITE